MKTFFRILQERLEKEAAITCTRSHPTAPMRPESAVVVTSWPRRRSPSAIARGIFSSRWNRIGVGILGRLPTGRGGLRFHNDSKLFVQLQLLPNLLPVAEIVGQCSVHLRQTEVRILPGNLLRGQAVDLMVTDNVLDANPGPGNARLSIRATLDVRSD